MKIKIECFGFVLEKTDFPIKNKHLSNEKMEYKESQKRDCKIVWKREVIVCKTVHASGKTFVNAMFCHNKYA